MLPRKTWTARDRQRLSPSLRKILLLLVLLLVPIFLAGAGFLVYSMLDAREIGKDRITAAARSQLDELDESLSRVNLYLTETLLSNPLTAKISESEDAHDRYVAARSLWDEFDRQNNFWAGDFNLMFYCPSRSITVSRFDSATDYADNDELRTLVKSYVDRLSAGESRLLWQPVAVNGSAYLLQIYAYRGNFVACWLSCANAFSILRDAALSQEGFYAVLDGSGSPVLGWDELKERNITLSGGEVQSSGWNEYCEIFDMHRANLRLLVDDIPYLDQESLVYLLAFFCVILLIILAFAIYTLTYFHRYIETPFRQIQNHISDYVSVRESVKRRGFAELDEAVDAFDSLTKQLNDLKIDVYEEKLVLARTELEFYQLQIKPHFFVNCFSIIFGMAQKKDYARIQEFCLKLSNYVRYLFRNGFTRVTLGEELAVIRDYLQIQDIRHRTENQMMDHVDGGLLSREIPPLLLLTFVENAVKHADAGNLTVCIGASALEGEEERKLRFTVGNNGSKFPEEQLARLNSPAIFLEKANPEGRGLGVRNIWKRLSLIYGSRFSLTFSNTEHGALVEILIPDEPGPKSVPLPGSEI